MTPDKSHDHFASRHPFLAGLGFTAVLLPGIYLAADRGPGEPISIWMVLAIGIVVSPLTGFMLKHFADRRGS